MDLIRSVKQVMLQDMTPPYEQLQECPSVGTISETDRTWLLTRLKAICKAGADETHIAGSSSVNPGTPVLIINGTSYTEFPDVIKEYLRTKVSPAINAPYTAECFPWMITVPALKTTLCKYTLVF